MQARRWLNQSQPQTLVIACFLLYINAAFGVLGLLSTGTSGIKLSGLGFLYYLVTIGGGVAAGYGIANERKWGYVLGLVTAFFPFALSFYLTSNPFATNLLNLIFEIALVVLLLHTESREYQKVWFK
jgi:hypothetical protein